MLLSTITTAPSCQWSPCMKNSSAAQKRPGPGEAGHVPLLAARAVDQRADDRQQEGAGDRGEAGQVERQRARPPGASPSTLTVRCAGVVGGVAAAGRAAGDGDHVRREQHRERRSCSTPSWPSRTSSRPSAPWRGAERPQVGDPAGAPSRPSATPSTARAGRSTSREYVGPVGHQAVDAAVEQLRASRRGRRRSRRAPACRRRARGVPDRGVATASAAARCGTWSARPRPCEPAGARRPRQHRRTPRPRRGRGGGRRPVGPASRRKRRSRRRGERPDAAPGPAARARRRSAASGATAASDLRSMLKRASGNASKSSARVGICSRRRPGAGSSAKVEVADGAAPSVTRSSSASWKASRTPSLVTWTSVSR